MLRKKQKKLSFVFPFGEQTLFPSHVKITEV